MSEVNKSLKQRDLVSGLKLAFPHSRTVVLARAKTKHVQFAGVRNGEIASRGCCVLRAQVELREGICSIVEPAFADLGGGVALEQVDRLGVRCKREAVVFIVEIYPVDSARTIASPSFQELLSR